MARPAGQLTTPLPETAEVAAPVVPASERMFLATAAVLFIGSAAGTIAWCGSMSGGMPMPGGWTMSMAWMRMAGQSWAAAAASFLGMWVVMMVAMMLPSLAAMLSGYRRAIRVAGGARLGKATAIAGAGYFVVWTIFGAVAYPLGVVLAAAEMRWPGLSRAVPTATGVVLMLAGCIQVSRWKARRLMSCRESSECGVRVAPELSSPWRHGLRLGVHCALCCSGFMAALFVAGVMDLGVMAVVAAAITIERLAPRPVLAARATGVFVIAAAVAVLLRALGAA